jgi:hypothetical protein
LKNFNEQLKEVKSELKKISMKIEKYENSDELNAFQSRKRASIKRASLDLSESLVELRKSHSY